MGPADSAIISVEQNKHIKKKTHIGDASNPGDFSWMVHARRELGLPSITQHQSAQGIPQRIEPACGGVDTLDRGQAPVVAHGKECIVPKAVYDWALKKVPHLASIGKK